jgi:4-pyridoxolactonase
MKVHVCESGSLVLDKSFITWNHGHGIEVRFPVYFLYIEHPDGKLLVDTGMDRAFVDKNLPFEKPMQAPDQTMEAALAKCGAKPKDISLVIMSHLHFDHCCANRLFPHATFLVGRKELEFAYNPMFQKLGYWRELFDLPELRYEAVWGDVEVVKGVSMVFAPGHTPGHYAVTTELPNQLLVFAIDTAYTKENMEKKIPTGFHTNPIEQVESMARLERIAFASNAPIFYSHDPDEFKNYTKAPQFYA